MTRALVLVEGETEESFVNDVLAAHLRGYGYLAVSARLVGNARLRSRRGGIRGWDSARKDVIRHLRQDDEWLVTTMVDYYALPQTGSRAWPGREVAGRLPLEQRASAVESALLQDVCNELGDDFNPRRFIPFVVMHEFEGLLFSDCDRFASGIGQQHLARDFQQIRSAFRSPEEINDSPLTAPSKRIEELFPSYQKPLHGNLAMLEMGLTVIRQECPHFADWLARLEQWPRWST